MERLIETVRQNPILYDRNHPDYMRSNLKVVVWNKIAHRNDLKSGSNAKNIWFKLRGCHRDAIRRRQKISPAMSALTPGKYWKYEDDMAFLMPYMNISLAHSSESPANAEETRGPAQGPEVESPNTISMSEHDDESESNSRRKKKRKLKASRMSLEPLPSNCKDKPKSDGDTEDDSLYHFFMSMYAIVKKLSPTSQYTVKKDIFKTVSDAEAGMLNLGKAPPNVVYQIGYPKPYSSSFPNTSVTYNNHSDSDPVDYDINLNDDLMELREEKMGDVINKQ